MTDLRTQRPAGARHWWVVLALLGAAGAAVTWTALGRDSTLTSIWELVFKIAVFLVVAAAVATFPQGGRWHYLLACLPFVAFLGFVLPRISYFGFFGGEILDDPVMTGELYTYLYLLLYPGIVLSVCAAYRLGGGPAGSTLKIAITGVVLIFSGFLDILWPLVNPVPLPEQVPAEHIRVVLGHVASYREAVWFTVAHLPLLVAVQFLPLQRWLARFDVDLHKAR